VGRTGLPAVILLRGGSINKRQPVAVSFFIFFRAQYNYWITCGDPLGGLKPAPLSLRSFMFFSLDLLKQALKIH
jgi:hypothetical protein